MFVTGGAKWWLAVQSIHSWPGGRGSYYASHANKLKRMVGVAINTYLVAQINEKAINKASVDGGICGMLNSQAGLQRHL